MQQEKLETVEAGQRLEKLILHLMFISPLLVFGWSLCRFLTLGSEPVAYRYDFWLWLLVIGLLNIPYVKNKIIKASVLQRLKENSLLNDKVLLSCAIAGAFLTLCSILPACMYVSHILSN